jgi:Tol biopolymer transport system component
MHGTGHLRHPERSVARHARVTARCAGVIALIAMVSGGCTSSATPSDDAASSATAQAPSSPSPSSAPAGLVPTVVPIGAGAQQTILDLPADTWNVAASPDGKRIAYVTRSKDVGICGGCSDVTRVVVANVDGTGAHYITLAGPIGDVHTPAWSPDGRQLAYVGTRAGNADIYVASTRGGSSRRLTHDPGQDEVPAWAPDGGTIAYDNCGSTPCDDSGLSPTQEIWTIPSSGGAPYRLTTNHVPDQAPTYAPDDSRVAFFHDGAIFMTGPRGGPVRSIIGGDVVEGWSPAWSPNGSTIAFLVFTGDRAMIEQTQMGQVISLPLGKVEVVDLATGKITSLDASTASSYNPVSWMPSSTAVLVDSYAPA